MLSSVPSIFTVPGGHKPIHRHTHTHTIKKKYHKALPVPLCLFRSIKKIYQFRHNSDKLGCLVSVHIYTANNRQEKQNRV